MNNSNNTSRTAAKITLLIVALILLVVAAIPGGFKYFENILIGLGSGILSSVIVTFFFDVSDNARLRERDLAQFERIISDFEKAFDSLVHSINTIPVQNCGATRADEISEWLNSGSEEDKELRRVVFYELFEEIDSRLKELHAAERLTCNSVLSDCSAEMTKLSEAIQPVVLHKKEGYYPDSYVTDLTACVDAVYNLHDKFWKELGKVPDAKTK